MTSSPSPSSASNPRRRRGALRRSGVSALALALVAVVGVLPASPASATTNHARLGDVSATLTYQGTYPTPRAEMITITRAGHVVYRAAVRSKFCGTLCWPSPAYGNGDANPLRVVRLEPGSPDVVLGLYSAGAHCCYLDEVFAPATATSSTYAESEILLGDPGALLKTLPGSPYVALVTADDTFAYAFTDYAASGLPLKIMRFSGHGFRNVTKDYPALIRADASMWLKAFYSLKSTHYADSVGVIAAWAADQYQLGRAANANAFLRQQAAAGHLNNQLTPSQKGLVFVAALEKFLRRDGY
ncbi:MAG: hypothetical protein KGI65_01800 [Acidobacteriota bacterium]|nr:hypothetical protein [Acidobacteriota bacterium]MDE3093743.1 hypothetical protein [Acidobacteriota bacterium]